MQVHFGIQNVAKAECRSVGYNTCINKKKLKSAHVSHHTYTSIFKDQYLKYKNKSLE